MQKLRWCCCALAFALIGCSNSKMQQETHDLSKGKCRNIDSSLCQGQKCAQVEEFITKNHCDMLGGTFKANARNKRSWWLW